MLAVRAYRSLPLATLLALLLAPAATAASWDGIPPPSARHSSAMVYDSQRNRVVVYGGDECPTPAELRTGDVWAVSLAPSYAWSRIVTTGPPSGGSGHTAIYDAARDRLISYGSEEWVKVVSVLSFSGDGGAWTRDTAAVSANAPPSGLRFHSAILDPVRDRMIVFGGVGQTPVAGPLNRVWAVPLSDLSAWTELTPGGPAPPARQGHVAVYDAPRDRMIVIGGEGSSGVGPLNDVWALSLSGTPQWTQLSPTGGAPTARSQFVAAYDAGADRVVLFGGRNASGGALGDAWSLSLSGTPAWTPLSAANAPSARYRHGGAFDPATRHWIVFGGADPNPRNDVWRLALDGVPQWTEIMGLNTYEPRLERSAMFDARRDRMLVFGGYDLMTYLNHNDTQQLTFTGVPTWSPLAVVGTTYSRKSAQAIHEPVRDRMLIAGGHSSNQQVDVRTHISALALEGSPTWTELQPICCPPQQFGSPLTYDPRGDRLLVLTNPNPQDGAELWALTFSPHLPPVWSRLPVPLGPLQSGQSRMNLMLDPLRDRLYAFVYPNDAVPPHLWELPLSPLGAWGDLGDLPSALSDATPSYDPVRDRILLRGTVGTWSLDLAAGSPVVSELDYLVPPRFGDDFPNVVPSFYDPLRDRLVTVGENQSRMETWTLAWNEPVAVAASCPDTVRGRGNAVPVHYQLSHGASGARAIHWRVRNKRNWSDPMRHGVQIVAAGEQADLVVPVAIPDTAAAGEGAIEMTAWFAGAPGNDATCTVAIARPTTATPEVPAGVTFALRGPRPQPAYHEARLELTVPARGLVGIDVFDIRGRRVTETRMLQLAAGTHVIPVQNENAGPSLYFVRATYRGQTSERRVIFLK